MTLLIEDNSVFIEDLSLTEDASLGSLINITVSVFEVCSEISG